MSARNGDRSKFNANRKAKIARRLKTREMREGIAAAKKTAAK
jgi:hypothetical protein